MEFGSLQQLVRFYYEFSSQRNFYHHEHEFLEKINVMAIENASKTTQIEVIRNLYFSFCNNFSDDTKTVLITKWEDLSLIAANNITSPEAFNEVFNIFPDYSEAKKVALQKMLSYC